MISVSWTPEELRVRVTGGDRFLAWPGTNEVALPTDLVTGATYHPTLAAVPDRTRLFGSVGHGMRTIPVVPGQWVFGRRRINSEHFFFAVRGRATPVLVVAARDWPLNGIVVSTPRAAEIAVALSGVEDTRDQGSRAS